MTVLDVLRGAADYLGKKGVESPRLNAEHLLAHTLGKKRLELYLAFDRPMNEAERTSMREATRARGERIPLQHLLGTAEFFGRTFKCDPRALIPRPETEQLVELLLRRRSQEGSTRTEARLQSEPEGSPLATQSVAGGAESSTKPSEQSERSITPKRSEADSILTPDSCLLTPVHAVDIGTGSGVIALTLALERPSWRITATDISPEALTLARENADTLKTTNVTFLEADLLPPDTAENSLDLIVANLPYIADPDLPTLQPEVQHDPRLALAGGLRGTELIERLLPLAHVALREGGLLALETGEGHPELLAPAMTHWRTVEPLRDYQDRSRFLFAVK